MKKVVFIFMLVLGFAWNCHAQTWTYVQDSLSTYCSAGSSSCTLQSGNVLPTTAGSVWVVYLTTNSNNFISNVTGGGGSWVHCPSCQIWNATLSRAEDAWYNLSGNAGTINSVVVTLNSAAVGQFGLNFIELLPPSGYTASYDTSGTTSTNSCTTCTGVGFGSLGGTDVIIQSIAATSPSSWHAWSSPYATLPLGEGINLNATSGTAPTVTTSGPGAVFSAIAFKSSAGSFAPPPLPISVVNYAASQGLNCSPSCSLGVSVGSGHLLYIESGTLNGTHISSVSGGGTPWVIPSGANTCQITLPSSDALSCAYILSSTSGSLSVTMSGNSNVSFTVWEVASTNGPFTFDVQGSAQRAASYNPSGIALSLTGTNDVIFQSAFVPGGTSAVSFYPMPRVPGQGTMFFNNNAANAALLNTTNGAAPLWANQQNNATVVTGVAFRTGTALAPAPPTGLAAVVN
jgi:hypothetical protein